MDCAHASDAGNGGDVFKHVALVALLEELLRDPAPLLYIETHAGDGLYPLGSAGEWGAGVQQIWKAEGGLVGRYARLARDFSPPGAARPEAVAGSPLIAARLLRPQDRLLLHEIDPQSAAVLRRAVGCCALRAPPVAGQAGSSVGCCAPRAPPVAAEGGSPVSCCAL